MLAYIHSSLFVKSDEGKKSIVRVYAIKLFCFIANYIKIVFSFRIVQYLRIRIGAYDIPWNFLGKIIQFCSLMFICDVLCWLLLLLLVILNMTAEFQFCSDNFEILNFQTCQLWKLKKSILQILTWINMGRPVFSPLSRLILKITHYFCQESVNKICRVHTWVCALNFSQRCAGKLQSLPSKHNICEYGYIP